MLFTKRYETFIYVSTNDWEYNQFVSLRPAHHILMLCLIRETRKANIKMLRADTSYSKINRSTKKGKKQNDDWTITTFLSTKNNVHSTQIVNSSFRYNQEPSTIQPHRMQIFIFSIYASVPKKSKYISIFRLVGEVHKNVTVGDFVVTLENTKTIEWALFM